MCVCVSTHLVSVLSPVTLSQDNPALCYRLLLNKGLFFYYHIIISLSVYLCLLLSLFNMSVSVCLFLSLSPRYQLYQLTVMLCVCVCVCVCVCLLACLLVCVSEREREQGQTCACRSEVVFVAKCFNQLLHRAACLMVGGGGHSCRVKRCSRRRSRSPAELVLYLAGIYITKGYLFWTLFCLYLISHLQYVSLSHLSFTSTICASPFVL